MKKEFFSEDDLKRSLTWLALVSGYKSIEEMLVEYHHFMCWRVLWLILLGNMNNTLIQLGDRSSVLNPFFLLFSIDHSQSFPVVMKLFKQLVPGFTSLPLPETLLNSIECVYFTTSYRSISALKSPPSLNIEQVAAFLHKSDRFQLDNKSPISSIHRKKYSTALSTYEEKQSTNLFTFGKDQDWKRCVNPLYLVKSIFDAGMGNLYLLKANMLTMEMFLREIQKTLFKILENFSILRSEGFIMLDKKELFRFISCFENAFFEDCNLKDEYLLNKQLQPPPTGYTNRSNSDLSFSSFINAKITENEDIIIEKSWMGCLLLQATEENSCLSYLKCLFVCMEISHSFEGFQEIPETIQVSKKKNLQQVGQGDSFSNSDQFGIGSQSSFINEQFHSKLYNDKQKQGADITTLQLLMEILVIKVPKIVTKSINAMIPSPQIMYSIGRSLITSSMILIAQELPTLFSQEIMDYYHLLKVALLLPRNDFGLSSIESLFLLLIYRESLFSPPIKSASLTENKTCAITQVKNKDFTEMLHLDQLNHKKSPEFLYSKNSLYRKNNSDTVNASELPNSDILSTWYIRKEEDILMELPALLGNDILPGHLRLFNQFEISKYANGDISSDGSIEISSHLTSAYAYKKEFCTTLPTSLNSSSSLKKIYNMTNSGLLTTETSGIIPSKMAGYLSAQSTILNDEESFFSVPIKLPSSKRMSSFQKNNMKVDRPYNESYKLIPHYSRMKMLPEINQQLKPCSIETYMSPIRHPIFRNHELQRTFNAFTPHSKFTIFENLTPLGLDNQTISEDISIQRETYNQKNVCDQRRILDVNDNSILHDPLEIGLENAKWAWHHGHITWAMALLQDSVISSFSKDCQLLSKSPTGLPQQMMQTKLSETIQNTSFYASTRRIEAIVILATWNAEARASDLQSIHVLFEFAEQEWKRLSRTITLGPSQDLESFHYDTPKPSPSCRQMESTTLRDSIFECATDMDTLSKDTIPRDIMPQLATKKGVDLETNITSIHLVEDPLKNSFPSDNRILQLGYELYATWGIWIDNTLLSLSNVNHQTKMINSSWDYWLELAVRNYALALSLISKYNKKNVKDQNSRQADPAMKQNKNTTEDFPPSTTASSSGLRNEFEHQNRSSMDMLSLTLRMTHLWFRIPEKVDQLVCQWFKNVSPVIWLPLVHQLAARLGSIATCSTMSQTSINVVDSSDIDGNRLNNNNTSQKQQSTKKSSGSSSQKRFSEKTNGLMMVYSKLLERYPFVSIYPLLYVSGQKGETLLKSGHDKDTGDLGNLTRTESGVRNLIDKNRQKRSKTIPKNQKVHLLDNNCQNQEMESSSPLLSPAEILLLEMAAKRISSANILRESMLLVEASIEVCIRIHPVSSGLPLSDDENDSKISNEDTIVGGGRKEIIDYCNEEDTISSHDGRENIRKFNQIRKPVAEKPKKFRSAFSLDSTWKIIRITAAGGLNIPVLTANLYSTSLSDNGSYLLGWSSKGFILNGINAPKAISCYANDGSCYKQLFKARDDLRQDALVLQVMKCVTNTSGEYRTIPYDVSSSIEPGSSNRSKLYSDSKQASGFQKPSTDSFRTKFEKWQTYSVVPLQRFCGVIGMIEGCTSLGDWLMDAYARYHHIPPSITPEQALKTFTARPCDSSHSKERLKQFQQIQDNFPPILRYFFWEQSSFSRCTGSINSHSVVDNDNIKLTSSSDDTIGQSYSHYSVSSGVEKWLRMRIAYSESVGITSIIGWVVGLGDRHLQNILISLETGSIIHIDLNLIFETGKLLKVPERVPFRLTREIRDGLMRPWTTTTTSSISGTAFAVDASKTKISNILTEQKEANQIANSHYQNSNYSPDLPLEFSAHCMLPLPLGIFGQAAEQTLCELQAKSDLICMLFEAFKHDPLYLQWRNDPNEADRALKGIRDKLDSSTLSPSAKINSLVREAMDPNALSLMYHGWQSWM